MIETFRRDLREAGGKLECLRMAHLECGRIIEFGHLPLDSLDDFRASVPCIHAPKAGRSIETASNTGQ